MPISTSSFDDDRDSRYGEYEQADEFVEETIDVAGLTPTAAARLLKRLGGGIDGQNQDDNAGQLVEGIGWNAEVTSAAEGVSVCFRAHDELLDDLIRRFEEMAQRALNP